jgi:hypothetical protein
MFDQLQITAAGGTQQLLLLAGLAHFSRFAAVHRYNGSGLPMLKITADGAWQSDRAPGSRPVGEGNNFVVAGHASTTVL